MDFSAFWSRQEAGDYEKDHQLRKPREFSQRLKVREKVYERPKHLHEAVDLRIYVQLILRPKIRSIASHTLVFASRRFRFLRLRRLLSREE